MFDKLFGGFGGFGCGCDHRPTECNTSCDVLWIVILLMILFNGGLFGLDICTLIILFILFGGCLFGKGERRTCEKRC